MVENLNAFLPGKSLKSPGKTWKTPGIWYEIASGHPVWYLHPSYFA